MFLHYAVRDLLWNCSYRAFITQRGSFPACPQISGGTLAHGDNHDGVPEPGIPMPMHPPDGMLPTQGRIPAPCAHTAPISSDWSSARAYQEQNNLLLTGYHSSFSTRGSHMQVGFLLIHRNDPFQSSRMSCKEIRKSDS